MKQPLPQIEKRRLPFFVLFLPACAILDFAIPMVIYWGALSAAPILISLAIGTVFAQVCFLSIWVALGPFGPWTRWTTALATSVVLCFSFYLGALIAFPYAQADQAFEVLALVMLVPLLLLVAQIPPWIRRSISGWRIVRIGAAESPSTSPSRPVGARHVLIVAIFVAFALWLANTAMPHLEPPVSRASPAVQIYPHTWTDLGTLCVMVVLYNMVWIGPSLRFCFLARDKKAGLAAMMTFWFGVSVLVIVTMTAIATVSGAGATPHVIVTAIFVAFGATAAVLTASLHLLRASGYTMIQTKTASLFDGLFVGRDRLATAGRP